MSPAGRAAVFPAAARLAAALLLLAAALLALAGCHAGYPHACDGHGGTRGVIKDTYVCDDGSTVGAGWLRLHPDDPRSQP